MIFTFKDFIKKIYNFLTNLKDDVYIRKQNDQVHLKHRINLIFNF